MALAAGGGAATPALGQRADQDAAGLGGSFAVRDTFDAAREAAADPAHAARLLAIGWQPQAFEVRWQQTLGDRQPRVSLAFASPRPTFGRADRDTEVELKWYRPPARGEGAAPGPALVVVHSLAPSQPLARGIANAAAAAGVDAFVVTLPGFGGRHPTPGRSPGAEAVLAGAGGVADVRRALDVVAALPGIDGDRIVLAGVSLGSFAAATVSAMDRKPAATVSFLGGGSAFAGLRDGAKDAAWLREELLRSEGTLQAIEAVLAPIEPQALAGRLNPERVWVISATGDTVIRHENAEAFVRAIGGRGLAEDHWIRRPGNHYTAAFALPGVAELCIRVARETPPANRPLGGE